MVGTSGESDNRLYLHNYFSESFEILNTGCRQGLLENTPHVFGLHALDLLQFAYNLQTHLPVKFVTKFLHTPLMLQSAVAVCDQSASLKQLRECS